MFRLRKPTRREVHTVWLIAAGVVALIVTRAAMPAVFLAAYFVLWLIGYWALVRAYK